MQIVELESSLLLKSEAPFVLESGHVINNLKIRYNTYGELNQDKSNVVWVFHALTGDHFPMDWWSGVVGRNGYVNPEKHFIVCANAFGSCYGSTEPKSFDFPVFTIADIVAAKKQLAEHLGIGRIKIGIGGSMGGQQLLEWAVQEPERFEAIVPIATNAIHSPWGIAFNEAQRMAMQQSDLEKGLEAARAIGMLSYRHYHTFDKTQLDADGRSDHFSASSYLQYQGEKLRNRFSPYSYWFLSKAMDSQNVGRNFGGPANALKRIKSQCIAIGIDTDMLFPINEQKFIADHVPSSTFHVIKSDYGHDGFLIETEEITKILEKELNG